jgi:hypothetical protein
MSTIHLHQTTTSTPEQYIAGLTDFGPGRSKLFGNSADGYLKVHDRGPSQADVRERRSERGTRIMSRVAVSANLLSSSSSPPSTSLQKL